MYEKRLTLHSTAKSVTRLRRDHKNYMERKVKVKVTQFVSNSLQPRILQASILEWVSFPNPGIKPWSPALQADSLPAEP